MGFEIKLLQNIFPSILISTNKPSIYLTFDDGPHPVATPLVLEILKKLGVRATFFLIGQNVKKYPELTKQIYFDGHQIANHTYSHANLFFKNKATVKNEIMQTEEIISSIIGKQSKFFRPPYGYFDWTTLNTLKDVGLTCALWSIDSKDFKLSPSEITQRVLTKINNGSIILFHDNDLTTQKLQSYLPITIETLLQEGFIFDTLQL